MSNSELIQAHHRARKAVIYIRQSSGHQVVSNLESRKMQHAMREHALALGWGDHHIEVVETDTGRSADSTAGRDGYKTLLSQIALGLVGIVLSYESARLSRNCSDWYPLLDVCAYHDCLVADRDGVYDPATPNGRLLLGVKGILSEVEQHTLRGRLIAGVLNKARRGELALVLPIGLTRLPDGRVIKDPNVQVQEAIELIFRTFLELGSMCKVICHLRANELRIPRRHANTETIWREPTTTSIARILKNPVYAGAFVYGRTQSIRRDASDARRPKQQRRPMDQWRIVVRDRYPAYVSWDTFERVQSMLRDNYAQYDRNRTRGVPRDGAALLQGITYCGVCGHKMMVQYKRGSRYLCNYLRQQTREPMCQYLPADPIDRHVIAAFFEALAPIHLDAYDAAVRMHDARHAEIERARQRELQRLRYEVQLARRQYDRVDPDNRLVASELERRWEDALRALQQAEAHHEQVRTSEGSAQASKTIAPELRNAFESLGKSLPKAWIRPELKRAQRKALLRCLIEKVVLHRTACDRVRVRIVWHGGEVTDTEIAVPTRSMKEMTGYETMKSLVLKYESEGKSDDEIARLLTEQGYHSPRCDRFLPNTVQVIRLAQGRIHRFDGPRPRRVEGFLTIPQLAQALGVKPEWLHYQIRLGHIQAQRDENTGLYLFPDRPSTLAHLRRLCKTYTRSAD
jgi:DNA invertase Pin-like site-specific DNA recombinase